MQVQLQSMKAVQSLIKALLGFYTALSRVTRIVSCKDSPPSRNTL